MCWPLLDFSRCCTMPSRLARSRILAGECDCLLPSCRCDGTSRNQLLLLLNLFADSRAHKPSTITERRALTMIAIRQRERSGAHILFQRSRRVEDMPQDRSVCGREASGMFSRALDRRHTSHCPESFFYTTRWPVTEKSLFTSTAPLSSLNVWKGCAAMWSNIEFDSLSISDFASCWLSLIFLN